jgi:hypothetical protein
VISATPLVLEMIAGTPAAIASRAAIPNGSTTDGRTNTELPASRISRSSSETLPRNITWSPMPSAAVRWRRCEYSDPSPAMTNRTSGN